MVEVHCFCFLVIEFQSYFPAFQLDRLQKFLRLFDIISKSPDKTTTIKLTNNIEKKRNYLRGGRPTDRLDSPLVRAGGVDEGPG